MYHVGYVDSLIRCNLLSHGTRLKGDMVVHQIILKDNLVEDLKDARKDPMHFLQAIQQTFDACPVYHETITRHIVKVPVRCNGRIRPNSMNHCWLGREIVSWDSQHEIVG